MSIPADININLNEDYARSPPIIKRVSHIFLLMWILMCILADININLNEDYGRSPPIIMLFALFGYSMFIAK